MKSNIQFISLMFLIGFLSASFINFYLLYGFGLEMPSSNTSVIKSNAPSNFIEKEQIEVYNDKVVINVKDASIGEYANTGSMKPVLDENSNGIRIKPLSEKDINVGDIISYKNGNRLIIHRVVDKGVDEEGVYFITKGDNNNYFDGKVRFKDVEYKTIGIIW